MIGLLVVQLVISAVSLSAEFRNASTGSVIEPVSIPGIEESITLPVADSWQLIVTVSPTARKTAAITKDVQKLAVTVTGAAWTPIIVYAESAPGAESAPDLTDDITLAFDTDRKWYARLGMFVFPATALIDPSGKLVWQRSGHSLDWMDVTNDTLRRFLGLAPSHKAVEEGPTQNPEAERQYRLALALSREHRTQDARLALDSALKLDSEFALAHLQLAQWQVSQGYADSAGESYSRALRADTSLYQAWIGKGELAFAATNSDDALAAANRALAINSRSPDAMGLKVRVLLDLEQYVEAEQILDRLLLSSPGKADVRYYLGLVYEKTGRTELALEAYREALLQLIDSESK
jgi:Tfp pilus assembly protein PilF